VQISECLTVGEASKGMIAGRRHHRFLIAGFDYDPGEKLFWLSQDGRFLGEPGEFGTE
jgi:hypothetical protein